MPFLINKVSYLLIWVHLMSTGVFATRVRELFAFENGTFIENVAIRSNGHLLLTTLSNASLFTLNPMEKHPRAKFVTQIEGLNSLTGIAEIGSDKYAVTGGVTSGDSIYFNPGTATVAIVHFDDHNRLVTTQKVAHIPSAQLLNGLSSLPRHSHVVLSAESKLGIIYRIDTKLGSVDIAYQNNELLPRKEPIRNPTGVNGLKLQDEFLYISNSDRGWFGRYCVDAMGTPTSSLEIISSLGNDSAHAYDDFSLGNHNVAYVCRQKDSAVKINLNGRVEVILDQDSEVKLTWPTASILSHDRKTLYIVTGTGQVIAYDL